MSHWLLLAVLPWVLANAEPLATEPIATEPIATDPPRAVRAQLDRVYPGWRFADVDSSLARLFRTGERPGWVDGDFDGDGHQDYAVQIVRAAAPPDSAQLLLAFLHRPDGYSPVTVKVGGVHHGIYLGVARRGDHGYDLIGDTTFVYRSDAIEVFYGQEARETCLYREGGFTCLTTGD
jgi:hypothetical protein